MPPWPPRPASALGSPRLLAGPWLWSLFGNPGFFFREGPDHTEQERPITCTSLQEVSTSAWAGRTRPQLWRSGSREEGPSWHKGKRGHYRQRLEGEFQQVVPVKDAFSQPEDTRFLAKGNHTDKACTYKTPPCQHRKGKVPFLEQRVGRL